MDVYERFAENLLSVRQRRRMSQQELAVRAAIHRSQISLMESGKRLPRLDTLVKLAGALEVDVVRLTQGISWEPSIDDDGRFEVAEPPV